MVYLVARSGTPVRLPLLPYLALELVHARYSRSATSIAGAIDTVSSMIGFCRVYLVINIDC